jgi:hypothetical protein
VNSVCYIRSFAVARTPLPSVLHGDVPPWPDCRHFQLFCALGPCSVWRGLLSAGSTEVAVGASAKAALIAAPLSMRLPGPPAGAQSGQDSDGAGAINSRTRGVTNRMTSSVSASLKSVICRM